MIQPPQRLVGMMPQRIRERLTQQALVHFVGRDEELGVLSRLLDDDGPLVIHVHGLAGAGKSSLLDAFASLANQREAIVVRLDCRTIEPTERGLLNAIEQATSGHAEGRIAAVAEHLSQLGERVIVALDAYELFGLMDTWLRQVFVPALRDNVKVLFLGRTQPNSGWLTEPGWQNLFSAVTLGPLPASHASELLAHCGISDPQVAQRIYRFCHGHPIALKLAASIVAHQPDQHLEDMALPLVMQELVQLYLEGVDDPVTARALNAASVVRRTTVSLLQAMLPDIAPEDAFNRLQRLPFVDAGRDGLVVHDAVQAAVRSSFHAADPIRYTASRRSAWRQLRAELAAATEGDLWRYTADMLYLIENPVVREAFFRTGSTPLTVEPARSVDRESIVSMTRRHDGEVCAAVMSRWFDEVQAAFHVVRNGVGEVVGFYCLADAASLSRNLVASDPIARAWSAHLHRDPPPANQRVLFLRRWLGLDQGEAPSPIQAACWLDVKRAYIELRPHLRRVYLSIKDLGTYAPTAQRLRFRPLSECSATVGDGVYQTAMLDFGPSSVDGWLAVLVGAEVGVDDQGVLDVDARELIVNDRHVSLTRLEFELMLYLTQREGKAVPRAELLENVWGYRVDVASNVVDVVVRSLRRKLGDCASMIETVSGVGYRFRRDHDVSSGAGSTDLHSSSVRRPPLSA